MQLLLVLLLATGEQQTLLEPPFDHTLGFNRVGRFFINLYLGDGFRIDEPQGICGAKMVEEDDPSTTRDDHILTLFAVNSGSGQIAYNVKLLQPRLYGSAGSDTGQFNRPHGICCNSAGDVYVADTDNDRVVRLRYAGGTLHWVSVVDSGLSNPCDVALDSRGRLYVADSGNNRIVVCDSSGKPVASWTGGLEGPTAIAVLDAHAEYNEFNTDEAVVVDWSRSRLNVFGLSGSLQRQIDMRRIGLDEAAFAYCAFDRHGNIYVTDQFNNEVHLFDAGLKYIISYGRQGLGPSRFDSPRGITIWRRFGQTFIVERDGGQYYWLGLDAYLIGFYPQEFSSRQPGTTIALYVTEVADITVTVTDSAGKSVRSLTPPHQQRPGEVLIVWDGKDDKGRLVGEGEYSIQVMARPTYSRSRNIVKKQLKGSVRRVADG